jgi:phytoene synthase
MVTTEHNKKSRRSNFYYSFLLLPREKRQAIITLYEFCRRTDDIIDNNDSREHKSAALKEWKEMLIRSLNGEASSQVFAKLSNVVRRFKIPSELFLELIDGVTMDLTQRRYETFEDLYPYCYGVGSTVGLMSVEIFGYRSPGAKQYAINLGIALQLTNILRDLKADLSSGRIYMPQEDLRKCGYTEAEFSQQKVNRSFEQLIHLECARAREYFRVARSYLTREDLRTLYPAEAMAVIYQKLLRRIEQRPSNLYQDEIRLSFFSRFGTAFQAWMKYSLGLADAS